MTSTPLMVPEGSVVGADLIRLASDGKKAAHAALAWLTVQVVLGGADTRIRAAFWSPGAMPRKTPRLTIRKSCATPAYCRKWRSPLLVSLWLVTSGPSVS